MDSPTRRRGIVGPLLLVGAGILFLLANLGLIGWDAWIMIFRFWPVLLIAIGLELLIGRRSLLGSILVVVIVLGLIAGIIALYPSYVATTGGVTGGQPLTSETISQPLQGAKTANVDISYGAGQVSLGGLSDSDLLISGTVATTGGQQVTSNLQMAGDTANYRLAARLSDPGPFVAPWVRGSDAWDLKLNSGVPISLKLNGGVGTADIDLSQLKVTNLDANMGVGKTTIKMPSTGQVQGRVNGGVGEVTVAIPAGVAVRVRADSGLGGLNVPQSYQKQGSNVYVSPDWGSGAAPNRVDLTVHGGVGRLAIEQE